MKLQTRLGAALIFVTHDQVEAMTMGDRIGVLCDERLVPVGTPCRVYNFPNTFVASFVGTPAINLFDAAIDTEELIVVKDTFQFALDSAGRSRLNGSSGKRAKVCVGVRPEHVKLVPKGGIEGTVYGAENHGVEMIVTISIADHFIRATMPPTIPIALNQPVRIGFVQDKLHFFDVDSTENLTHARSL